MARQVLPIAGAVIGGFFGSPQLGFAIGSIIGNAVDPQVIKTPGLQNIPVQTASEGGYRQVVYGTCWVNTTNIIDFSDVRKVTQRERQGKGGGPVVESERLYRTYAIGLGEPLAGIRVIRRDGKIVYDVRPGSTILAESTAFEDRFRFYTGAEDQLPDPDLEALNGVGNTPYYRGTAYLVFPNDDLTDNQGRIPTYEVEGVQAVEGSTGLPVLVTNNFWYFGKPRALQLTDESLDFTSPGLTRVSRSGRYAITLRRDLIATINPAALELSKFDENTGQWNLIGTPSVVPVGFMKSAAWHPTEDILVVTGGGAFDATAVRIYRLVGDTLTSIGSMDTNLDNSPDLVAWDSSGTRLAITQAISSASLVCYDFDSTNGELTNQRKSGANVFNSLSSVFRLSWLPGTDYMAVGGLAGIRVFRDAGSSIAASALVLKPGENGVHWTYDGNLVAVGGTAPQIVLYEFDSTITGSETLNAVDNESGPSGASISDSSITGDGKTLAVGFFGGTAINAPYLYSLSTATIITPLSSPAVGSTQIGTLSFSDNIGSTIDGAPTDLRTILEDVCDRCGLAPSEYNMAALTDSVQGVTLGGNYNGASAVTLFMPAYFFDITQPDKVLVGVKRGAPAVETIFKADFVDEPDESILRGQDIEYPRQLMLKYLNPGQNYAAPAAVVSRQSPDIRVTGEAQVDLPISLSETEALQVADRILKVTWEDLNGEIVFSLPSGPFAWLAPTDCLGLSLRGGLYRIRVEKIEESAYVLKVTARRDRQSAYTSNLTALPLPAPEPPPPSLPGETTVALLNIPGVIDSDDAVGFRIGVCGQPNSAWYGANVAYSTDGGLSFLDLGNVTTQAVIGTLDAELAAASEFYTDSTNTLAVRLVNEDELETITQAQFLSEGNGAAIVRPDYSAELVQFRDAADQTGQLWHLTTLLRGRLSTSAAAHLSGATFVMLDSTAFIPLPSSLIGSTIKIRVTSLGTSPESAPVFDFVFNPAYCQTEFKPADLALSLDSGTITASWSPRFRFGTEDAPIASANLTGYRVEASDGVVTKVAEPVLGTTHLIDTTPFSGTVTVTVYPINRFTGLGPSIAGSIDL